MDLNGDGQLDLLSGSWPGELFLFTRTADGEFSAPEMIKDKDGNIINIGGGIDEQPDGGILITGNGEFEQTDDGWVVKYHGKTLKSTPDKPISVTGTASAAHAVDWDGDGDYDLLVGDIRGNVFLIPNEGDAKEYKFGKEKNLDANGEPLQVEGDAGPFVADWDNDGDLDLVVGDGEGKVSLFVNIGTRKDPKLSKSIELIASGSAVYGPEAPKHPSRGIRSKVCAVDWNGDGMLDLLVGDFATQQPDLPEPTPVEQIVYEKIRKELEEVNREFSQLISKVHGPSRSKDPLEQKQLAEKLNKVSEQSQALQAKLPPEYENHGWVWLFQRKASTENTK